MQKLSRLLFNAFVVFIFSGTLCGLELTNEKDYQELDQIALETGTDKSSAYHNYTRIYSQYFAKFKDQPLKFFKDLLDNLNYTGARTGCSDIGKIPPELEKTLTIYQKEIESIHFYNSLCIIIKR